VHTLCISKWQKKKASTKCGSTAKHLTVSPALMVTGLSVAPWVLQVARKPSGAEEEVAVTEDSGLKRSEVSPRRMEVARGGCCSNRDSRSHGW
jgi:hypothetical protein